MTFKTQGKKQPEHLWRDQYGEVVFARNTRELQQRAGGGRIHKQFIDRRNPKTGAMDTYWTGYIVGNRWFTRYAPVEKLESRGVVPEGFVRFNAEPDIHPSDR